MTPNTNSADPELLHEQKGAERVAAQRLQSNSCEGGATVGTAPSFLTNQLFSDPGKKGNPFGEDHF